MKLGVFDPIFHKLELEEMLDKVQAAGLTAIEIGCGGNPGNHHCPTDELLESEEKRKEYKEEFEKRGIEIGAFSTHNNPVSPDPEEAKQADEDLRKAIKLAALMDVPVVNTFSGTPGANEEATAKNWPVAPWPTEYAEIYEWQWEKKLIPYWKEIGQLAEEYNVKIAIEMHGGFSVHTPYTALKLRNNTSKNIGVNFDPSHMWWQGINPVEAIKILGKEDAIFHFHAKDTYMDQTNMNLHGVNSMIPYGEVAERSWTFRTVGYGHDMKEWNDMISELVKYGYNHVISIEHEDPLMSVDEGFNKAVDNLLDSIIENDTIDMFWA